MKENYNNRIYECRQQQHLSQKELSEILKLNNRSLLSYYERGMRSINFKTLIKLSEFFKVSIDYLLKRDEYRNHIEFATKCLGLNTQSVEILTKTKDANQVNILIANLFQKENE